MTTLAAPPLARRLGLVAWIGAAALLALPAAAMQFTDDVNWTALDFAVFGGMIALVVVPFQLALRHSRNLAALAAIAAALVTAFIMIWANLAVGIVGDGMHPVNLVFLGILALPIAGAVLVRGSTRGMAWVMLAMASLQATILAALAVAMPEGGVWLTGFFVAGWLLSAGLFHLAARLPDWHTTAD